MEIYVFEDTDGNECGSSTTDAGKARQYAQENGLRWIAYTYEFVDSELVEDYTNENDGE